MKVQGLTPSSDNRQAGTDSRPAANKPHRMHVSIAALSLPPGVAGEVKGELVACVEALHWKYRQPPAQVQLRICWWGAPAGSDTVVPFHASRGAGAAFPVASGPKFLVRYLRDMGSLTVVVEECPNARPIGTIVLDTCKVDVTRPLVASVQCLGSNRQVLATADVSLRIHYSQLLSSFEMAEHRASADKGLPLLPLPSVSNSRRQSAAHEAPASAAAAPPAVKSVSGIQASHHSRDSHVAGGKSRPPRPDTDSGQKQHQPPVPPSEQASQQPTHKAAGTQAHQLQAGASSQEETEKAQQLQAGAMSVLAAEAVATAAAAASSQAGCADDPLLEVIKKAEQLKASLDQAARSGILLALPNLQHQALQLQQPRLQAPHIQPQAVMTGSGHVQLAAPVLDAPAAAQSGLGLLQPASAAGGLVLPPALAARQSAVTNNLTTTAELLAVLAGGPEAHTRDDSSTHLDQPHMTKNHRSRRHRSKHSDAAAVSGTGINQSPACHCSTDSPPPSSSSSSSSDHGSSLLADLDDLEELEDLLLQELLSMRRPPAAAKRHSPAASGPSRPGRAVPSHHHEQPQQRQKLSSAVSGSPQPLEVAADQEQPAPTVRQQQGVQQEGPQLHVELMALRCLHVVPPTVTAVLKCAGQKQQLDATRLLQPTAPSQLQQGQPVVESGEACGADAAVVQACSCTIIGPPCLLQPLLAAQQPNIVVEVWAGDPSASAAGTQESSSQLLGIVRIPLQRPQQQLPHTAPQGSSSSHLDDAEATGDESCLALGSYELYDVLQGKAAGSLELCVSMLQDSTAPATDEPPVAQADNTQLASTAASSGAAAAAPAALPAVASSLHPEVVAVRHVIDITLVRVTGLPDAADLAAAQQPVPDNRFVKYSFPGDEPLYTQQVDCVASPLLSAHARHTVLLQPGESLADCFTSGTQEAITTEQLEFEVYDKWPDDTDSLAAAGSLPLEQVLELCQPDSPSSTTEDCEGRTATLLVQLSINPSAVEAIVAPAARTALLHVSICYSSSTCFALDDSPEADQQQQQEGNKHQLQQCQGVQDGDHGQQRGQDGQLAVCPHSPEAQEPQQQAKAVPFCSTDLRGADEPVQAPERTAPVGSNASYPCIQHSEVGHTDATVDHDRGTPKRAVEPTNTVGARTTLQGSAATPAAAGAAASPGPVPLTAELCVNIIRACGLQAAVKEAEGWLGNASGLLGRARQLGPHPYVTLALPPGPSGVKSVRTPFQAQSFCPQFNYQEVLPLSLDAATLSALSSSDAHIELWHHCPRSQAVAAALSRGHSSSYAMTGQQQVFLGSASLPLTSLLTHPQGIHSWVVLKSQLGVSVGAVQVQLRFTHIGGTPVDTCPAALSPLARCPEWLRVLPAAAARRLSSFASLPPSGFMGQAVRLSLHVEELLLGAQDDAALERPRIANYVATYRLPGSSQQCSSQPKACSSHAASSNLLARSWHVAWKFTSHHWTTADTRLAMALLGYPLVVTVAKQEPRKQQQPQSQGLTVLGKGQGGSMTAAAAAAVPCGVVELDLSSLLATRPGSSAPTCRWLSGTYPLIHPLSKSLGSLQLRLKVMLELQPAEAPPPQAWLDSHPDAHWQVSGPLAAWVDHRPTPGHTAAQAASASVVDGQPQLNTVSTTQEAAARSAAPAAAAPGSPRPTDEAGQGEQQHALDTQAAVCDSDLTAELTEAVDSSRTPSAAAHITAPEAPTAPSITAESAELTGASAATLPGSTASRTRLRAEVSHASAPPGAVGLTPAAAALASPRPAEHQQQLIVLPAAGSPSVSQQLGLQVLMSPGWAKLCDVRLCVECALNLELPAVNEGYLPALYVRYDWPGCVAPITTPLVEASSGPLGGCHSVKWFHCLHLPLPLALAPAQQQLQQHTAAPASANTGRSGSLVVPLQVWCRAVQAANESELPPLYSGLSAVHVASDVLVGCAAMDLSALQLLGAVDGWYNILDQQLQPHGQIKVSLTPLKPLDAPLCLLSQSADGMQQQLTAWSAASQASLSAPTTAAMLETSLMQLQQHVEQLQQSEWQQQDDFAALLHKAPASSMEAPGVEAQAADAVDQLSDLAFMALAAQSTAAAEAAAAAAEAAAGAGIPALKQEDLIDTLRSNLEELDALSAALAARIVRSRQPEELSGPEGMPSDTTPSLPSSMSNTTTGGGVMAGQERAGRASAAPVGDTPAACTDSFRHIRTLSDDEDYLVAAAGITESDVDTEELIGRVDWSLAANSDDEHDVPPGPPQTQQQQQQVSSAVPSGRVLQQPLNTEDWMFDIGRSSSSSRNSLAAPAAAAQTALPPPAGSSSGSSSMRPSSSQLPVHPGQMTPAQAQAAAAASAARLAQVDAAAAAAAARRAAQSAAAATRRDGPGRASEAAAADDAEGGSRRAADVWEQLALVEDQDEAAAVQRRERQRQRQEQQRATVVNGGGLLGCSDQQQQQHDPRRLPDELESRLDLLLAEFQMSASGPGALVGRAATGPLPQFGSYAAQASAAAAFGRLEGGDAWASDDFDTGRVVDSDDSGDLVPVQRVVHQSREDEGRTAAGARVAQGVEEGEVLPRVGFANALPPVQDDFVLEYSDGPPRRQQHQQHAHIRQQQRPQQQEGPTASTSVASRDTSSTSSGGRTPGYGSRTAAPTSSSMAADADAPATGRHSTAAGATAQVPSQSSVRSGSSGVSISTVGRRPVGGGGGAVDFEEMMFSISTRTPGSGRSSSSSVPGGSGSIRHPGM